MPAPTFYADSDIPSLMTDFGVPVVAGAIQGRGIVDYTDDLALQSGNVAGVRGKTIVVTVQTSAFPNVQIGSSVTVDGTAYTLRDRAQQGDGATTQWWCQR